MEASATAASEFIELWKNSINCDTQALIEAKEKCEHILNRVELAGRMIHIETTSEAFAENEIDANLLSDDRWKRLSWIFGPDAVRNFIGIDARGICLLLGFGEEWLDRKLASGTRFKLAIFPKTSVDGTLATWDGVENVVQKYYPEVWGKVENHMPEIRSTDFTEIQRLAGYDMQAVNLVGRRGRAYDVDGESDSEHYISLQRLQRREGTLVQVRQFLWDEIGIKGLFVGDGRTQNDAGEQGPREFLARNLPINDIEGHIVIEVNPSRCLVWPCIAL
uniref:Uncharacterized protein n=1 Tax=Fibrocapsa japonica TaxID=94617 RepID=A0A7S2UYZ7_9STRA|mmetsp:Transcript_17867/g.26040  ORF Transcript_17867/g.26040 Transcript_17867/m.26040 type:complete len:277 (+) Transcript_17867:87-917(+)